MIDYTELAGRTVNFLQGVVSGNESIVNNTGCQIINDIDASLVSTLDAFSKGIAESCVNLVSAPDRARMWDRHILDSIAGCVLMTKGASVADIGTGGGFPGAVIAAVNKARVTLVDSTVKKLEQVRIISEKSGIEGISLCPGRAEDIAHGKLRESFMFVSARALAPLVRSVELCLPFVKIGGYFLAWKGPGVEEELRLARTALKKLSGEFAGRLTYTVPGDSVQRHILVICKNGKCPDEYPRAWSSILKNPL